MRHRQAARPSPLRALAGWSPEPCPDLDPPAVDDLLGGLDAPAWLVDPLARATRGDPFLVLEAVGSVARLWAPRGTATSPAEALARLVAGDDPAARASRWVGSLDPAALDAAALHAEVAADVLADELDGLAGGGDAAGDAVRWLERRDELASVCWALGGGRGRLDAAVASLDRAARTHASLWLLAAEEAALSPRLAAVAWQEPRSWWADGARVWTAAGAAR